MMSFYSFAILLLVILTVVNAGEKVCPGYGFIHRPENCKSACSIKNDQCPTGTKCCFRLEQPCGYQCVIPKDNESKEGQCPARSSNVGDPMWFLCDGHECDVDSDCQGAKKCCLNVCDAPVCIPPQ